MGDRDDSPTLPVERVASYPDPLFLAELLESQDRDWRERHSPSLADFLLARIAEDEAAVRRIDAAERHQGGPQIALPFSVETLLAECEAKRRIVDECMERDDESPDVAAFCRSVLRSLALPYASHPGYLDEWAVQHETGPN